MFFLLEIRRNVSFSSFSRINLTFCGYPLATVEETLAVLQRLIHSQEDSRDCMLSIVLYRSRTHLERAEQFFFYWPDRHHRGTTSLSYRREGNLCQSGQTGGYRGRNREKTEPSCCLSGGHGRDMYGVTSCWKIVFCAFYDRAILFHTQRTVFG